MPTAASEGPVEGTRAAIASMSIRGATRISLAAAQALAEAAQSLDATRWRAQLQDAARRLASARPTAVSLENGLAAVAAPALAAANAREAAQAAAAAAAAWTQRIEGGRQAIVAAGLSALAPGSRVLTHCNSATATQLLSAAHAAGRAVHVYVTETRPWRQGHVTARELAAAGVPCSYIVDAAAGHVLAEGLVDAVVVGADTVCSDGSLVNKIGTSMVARAARDAKVPFICATSFCKFSRRRAQDVAIEQRGASEVANAGDLPSGVNVFNPVFDRTPADCVRAYATEDGLRPPAGAVAAALRSIPQEIPW